MKREHYIFDCEERPSEELLDSIAVDGWELITITDFPGYRDLGGEKRGRFQLYFSRPVDEEETGQ